jgi:hypothetical protein
VRQAEGWRELHFIFARNYVVVNRKGLNVPETARHRPIVLWTPTTVRDSVLNRLIEGGSVSAGLRTSDDSLKWAINCVLDGKPVEAETPWLLMSKLRADTGLWLGWGGLALLFVLLRWNNFNIPLTRDEGEYGYAAQLLLSGRLPYEDSFLQKPPMVAYSYALAGVLAPRAYWFPRVLAALCAALATALLGYSARREFGPGVALPAMWLLTPMLLQPRIGQFSANTETFELLPLMGVVAVYVHSRHANSSGGRGPWLAVGGLATLAVCYKYTVLPLLLLVFAVWTIEEWRGKGFRTAAARCLLALLAGTLTAAAVLGVFLAHDGGKKLWECTVVFNRAYVATSHFGLHGLWGVLQRFLRFWWILFIVPWCLLFGREPRVWFWAALFFMAWLAAAGSALGHYYTAVMPFWALLTAVALRRLAGWLRAKFRFDLPACALTAIVVGLVLWSDVPTMIRTPTQVAEQKLGPYGTFIGAPEVAGNLARLVPPNEYVYVAGSEPQILCYARRFSSTRFDIAYPLTLPTPLAGKYQAEAMADLRRRPPAAIVLAQSGSTWLRRPDTPPEFFQFLGALLDEQYEPVGGWLADGPSGRWQEGINREQATRYPLILFKRKIR